MILNVRDSREMIEIQPSDAKAYMATGLTQLYKDTRQHFFKVESISSTPVAKITLEGREVEWIDPMAELDCPVCLERYDFKDTSNPPVGLFCQNKQGNLTHLIHYTCLEKYWKMKKREDCPCDHRIDHIVPDGINTNLHEGVKFWASLPIEFKTIFLRYRTLISLLIKNGVAIQTLVESNLDWEVFSLFREETFNCIQSDEDFIAFAECKSFWLKKSMLLNESLMRQLREYGYSIKDVVSLSEKKCVEFFDRRKNMARSKKSTWVDFFGYDPSPDEERPSFLMSMFHKSSIKAYFSKEK